MSQLNVGTLNVSTVSYSDSSTTNTAPTAQSVIGGTPSADQVLKWDGSNWVAGDFNAEGRLLGIDVYTNQNGEWDQRSRSGGSATWTRPADCNHVLVYVTGGGGGSRVNDNNYRGAGGGGGATAIKYIDVSGVPSVSVTWGEGGNYSRNGGRGASGGSSSFGTYCTATGGGGGYTDNPYEGGRGGEATGGDINLPGGDGGMSHGSSNEYVAGASFWHHAGSNHHNSNDGAINTHGQWGSGGGHGHYSQNGHAHNNSVGGGGCVIIYKYS